MSEFVCGNVIHDECTLLTPQAIEFMWKIFLNHDPDGRAYRVETEVLPEVGPEILAAYQPYYIELRPIFLAFVERVEQDGGSARLVFMSNYQNHEIVQIFVNDDEEFDVFTDRNSDLDFTTEAFHEQSCTTGYFGHAISAAIVSA